MTYGRDKALELFLVGNKKSKLTILRIEKWDSKKTLKENAADLGIDYQQCVELAKNYHLEFVRLKHFDFNR